MGSIHLRNNKKEQFQVLDGGKKERSPSAVGRRGRLPQSLRGNLGRSFERRLVGESWRPCRSGGQSAGSIWGSEKEGGGGGL